MAQPKRKFDPDSYSFSALALIRGVDEEHISKMVWRDQSLRAAIPIDKFQSDFLKAAIFPNMKRPAKSLEIKWQFFYRDSNDIYQDPFVYIRHLRKMESSWHHDEGDLKQSSNFDEWEDDWIEDSVFVDEDEEEGWTQVQDINKNKEESKSKSEFYTVLICPDSNHNHDDFSSFDRSDELFCSSDGRPVYLAYGYDNGFGSPIKFEHEVSVEFCEGGLYRITASELKRYESSPASNRETIIDGHLLKAIGLMAILLSKEYPKCKIGDRPNASGITEKVLELAKQYEVSDAGLRALHTVITQAVEVLNGEEVNKVLNKK